MKKLIMSTFVLVLALFLCFTLAEVCEHEWGEYIETIPASCTESGTETAECVKCWQTQDREIRPLGHNFEDYVETLAPGCETEGEETATCTRCEATSSRPVNPLGHDWGDYVPSAQKPASCETDGEEFSTCSRCQATRTRIAYATGHCFDSYSTHYDSLRHITVYDNMAHDNSSHYLICDRCGERCEEGPHYSDCGSNGACYVCLAQGVNCQYVGHAGEPMVGFDTNSHWITCGQCGASLLETELHYKYCTSESCAGCGKTSAEGIVFAQTLHSMDTASLAPSDDRETNPCHSYACLSCGERATIEPCTPVNGVCSVCGGVIICSEHILPEGSSQAVTCETDGWRRGTCTFCGREVDETYPSPGHDYEMQIDYYSHWERCSKCGKTTEREGHYHYCDNISICEGCRADNTITEILFGLDLRHRPEYLSDYYPAGDRTDPYHCRYCSSCDGEVDFVPCNIVNGFCTVCGGEIVCPHKMPEGGYQPATCEEDGYMRGTCQLCGEYIDEILWATGHIRDSYYSKRSWDANRQVWVYTNAGLSHDSGYHWYICEVCGEAFGKEGHWLDCSSGSTCIYCGATGVYSPAFGDTSDIHLATKRKHDEYYHWEECTLCGQIVDKDTHCEYCDSPGWCSECGADVEEGAVIARVIHPNNYGAEAMPDHNNPPTHSKVCPGCGEVAHYPCEYDHYEEYPVCWDCGGYINCEALGKEHIPSEYTPATCLQEGHEGGFCHNCGAPIDKELPKSGHAWTDAPDTVDIQPTCETPGRLEYTCIYCGERFEFDYPALGHKFGEYTTTKTATCTENGEESAVCDTCGKTDTRVLPATGHKWGEYRQTTAPGCVTQGITTSTCSACHATRTRPLNALGHSYGEYELTTEPTCEEEGVETSVCSRCGETHTRTVPATGHEYGEYEVTLEPTCEEEGEETSVCAVCREFQTRAVPATGHEYGEYEITVPATCTEDGEEASVCTTCGDAQTRVIQMLGHWGEWRDIIQPTEETEGLRQKICRRCGIVLDSHTIPTLVGSLYQENVAGLKLSDYVSQPDGYSEDVEEIPEGTFAALIIQTSVTEDEETQDTGTDVPQIQVSRIKVVAGGYVVGELVFTVRDGRLSVEFEPVNRVYYGGIKLYLASSVDGLIDAEEFNINEEINAETLIDENGALFLRIESNVMLDEEELERYDVFDPNSEEYQQMMEQMLQILK